MAVDMVKPWQRELPLDAPPQPPRGRPRRRYEPLLDGMRTFGLKPPCEPGEEWRRCWTWDWLWASSHGRVATEGRWYRHPPSICRAESVARGGGYAAVGTRRIGNTGYLAGRARIVADAWHGPCPPGMMVRHLNGTTRDDRPANLAWGTASENALDKHTHGTMVMAKLTSAAVIGLLITDGVETDAAAARRLRVEATTVRSARTGKTWGHVAPWMQRRSAAVAAARRAADHAAEGLG